MLFTRPALPLLPMALCLSLLASSAATAQDSDAPPAPVPAPTYETTPPPLVPAEEPAPPRGELFPREPQGKALRGVLLVSRLILQPPAGVVVGAVMGAGSIIPIFFLNIPFCGGDLIEGTAGVGCRITYLGPIALIGATGAGLGVAGVGTILQGQGRIGATLAGAVVGAAGGISLAFATDVKKLETFALYGLVSSALGATVVYALTDAFFPEPPFATSRARQGLSVLPVLSATRAGGLMGGLAGRF